ncbi:hypothetical protein ACTFIZ_004733 [Dictyostelium cf. discoideum]
MADASVILFFRGFDGPIAGHAEWWFLSVFGCPINSFTEGGFRPNDHGYGQGQWNNFFGTAPPQNVYQYIINQVQSADRFFRLVNYPLAPSILRRINDCEAELLQSTANANQVPNLQNQVTHLQNQVANLQITNQQLVNLNVINKQKNNNNLIIFILFLKIKKKNKPLIYYLIGKLKF